MKLILFFVCSLILANPYSCPIPSSQQTQIYSDSVQFETSNADPARQDLVYNFNFPSPFSSIPQTVLGLNQFNSDESIVLEISLSVVKAKKEGLYLHAESKKSGHWKNLKLNLLATTRKDIEFGVVEIRKPNYGRENSFFMDYSIKEFTNLSTLKAKHFIKGFDFQSRDKQHVGIRHHSTSIQNNQIRFNFINKDTITIISSFSISVVCFNTYSPGVLYAEGTIEQNFVTSKTQVTIPRHGINELRTYIVGINSFQTSIAQSFSISSSIDEKFTLLIGPLDRHEIDYISVSYLIISIVDCGSCAGYPLLFDGICRVSCPKGTKEKNGKCIPIDCVKGYYLSKFGQCIPKCDLNQYYFEGRCTCKQSFYLINGRCTTCPQGTFFNYKTQKCENICGYNSQYVNGICHCLKGFYVINNSCQTCPPGTKYNNSTKSCLTICSQNQYFSGLKCVCKKGYYLISGRCSQCPAGTRYDKIRGCVCPPGLEWNQYKHKCEKTCRQYQINVQGVCKCIKNYYQVHGRCSQCPENSIYSVQNKTCLCGYNRVYKNGRCILLCTERQYYDIKFDKCIPYCEQYSEVWKQGFCICAPGFVRNPKDKICYPQCGPFQVRVRGKCQCIQGYHRGVFTPCQPITCPPGHQWNEKRRQCQSTCPPNSFFVNGKCDCLDGYEIQKSEGVCLPKCKDGSVRDRGLCVCPGGNKRINGRCTNCPPYTQYVNGKCLCYNGQLPFHGKCQFLSCPDKKQVWDPLLNACKCRKPLIWMFGRCQYMEKCGEKQYWTGHSCACKHGYILKYKKCVPADEVVPQCPPKSVFNGVNCQCLPGFYPIIPGKCLSCKPGTHWNGKECQIGDYACADGYKWSVIKKKCVSENPCGHNEVWDGIHCRCVQGAFFIEGKCQFCEYGTFFDGLRCVSTEIPQCNDGYKFWNGEQCVCLEGYFDLGERCVKCPKYTEWNGVCCKVKGGYKIDFTVPQY